MHSNSQNIEIVYKDNTVLVLKRFLKRIQVKIKEASFINDYLNFNCRGYSLDQLKLYLQNVKTISTKEINIPDLLNPNMIKWISHINFTNLQQLYITNSNLQSLEQLPLVKFPHLFSLSLKTNKITNITSIRKMHTPNLRFLNLDVNFFNEMWAVTQLYAPNLSYLHIRNFDAEKKDTIFIDSVFKLQTEPLEFFTSGDVNVFITKGKKQMKRKKYKKINYY